MSTSEVPRRIFYIVDWLPPDFGAVGQYGAVFAREMAAAGQRVHLIGLTSGPERVEDEKFPGGGELRVTRITAPPVNKKSNIRRLEWTFVTNVRLIRTFIRDPEARGSELIFTGSPAFMLYFALAAKWLRRARVRYRITDFFPEAIIANYAGNPPMALRLLQRLTWRMRRKVDVIEVIGEDQRRILVGNGIDDKRIVLKRDFSPIAISGNEEPAPKPAGLANHLVLFYSGNFGVAHDVDTVFEGYRLHHEQGSGKVALWLNASGTNADVLEEKLRERGLPYARTRPGPLSDLPHLMAAVDAHLISLRNEFSGYVLPSKVYACIDSKKAIVFVGPDTSDVDLLCRQAPGLLYCRVEQGNAEGFAAALEGIAAQVHSPVTA